MSSDRHRRAESTSATLDPDELSSVMGHMRLGAASSSVPRGSIGMPVPQAWRPLGDVDSDGKPLPSLPPSSDNATAPPLPPRPRPSHLSDRINPYDTIPPIVATLPSHRPPPLNPTPMYMPEPSHYSRPSLASPNGSSSPMTHAYSDPPPVSSVPASLRPGYTPGPVAGGIPYLTPPPLFPSVSTPNDPTSSSLSLPNPHAPSASSSSPSTSPSPSPSPGPFAHHAPNKRPRPSLPNSTPALLVPPSPTPGRIRASSVPPASPTTNGTSKTYEEGTVQCSGVTKTGKRCTRAVKSPHPLVQATPARADDVERFCHQHMKDILAQSGFYSRTVNNRWIEFDDWIPSYLSTDTVAALRTEMEKPPSVADVPGYIYCYEIRDTRTPNEVQLKVGRAVKLNKRLDEWGKQCGSKEVVLRGWWPGKVVDDDDDDSGGGGASLLRGRIMAGEKGKYCHRLERLIHLELSDIMINETHLSPEFLKPSNPAARATSPPPASPGKTATKKISRKKCPDCGTMHKEIFYFTRVQKGKLKGHEWDKVVQPVIEKWGKFVEENM